MGADQISEGSMMTRLTITVSEAAGMLGISANSAYSAVYRGEIPAVKIGGRWVVPIARLNELLGIGLSSQEKVQGVDEDL